MDCEKFDQHVIDALYEELDEVTSLALRRHVESCARCGAIWAGLVSARGAVKLTLEEPSADLEARILSAERATQTRAPWYRKALRGMAWAGSHAMRPQLAMAALFMLVIGSSLLLLRVRPGVVGSPVEVSEKGAPGRQASRGEADEAAEDGRWAGGKGKQRKAEAAAPRPAMEAPPPAATAAAMASGASDTPNDSPAEALSRARALKQSSGCERAAGLFRSLSEQSPGSKEADAAKQELADCEKISGQPAPSASAPGQGNGGGTNH